MLAALRAWVARDPGLACLALALGLAALLYAPSVPHGLTNYDDPWLYTDNLVVRSASWASVQTIFTDLDPVRRFTLGAEYLPVRDLSVMLDYAVFGEWYPGFHAVSLALYLGAIAVWFRALTALGVDRRVAGLAVLVWAVHPSHAESVAWLAERKGVLAALFSGAAVLGYARYRADGRARSLILGAIAAVCAVWSKAPATFTLAALAPLAFVGLADAPRRRTLIGLAAIGAATAAAFVPVLLVARAATVVGGAPDHASRLELVLGVHGVYARLAAMLTRDASAYPIKSLGPTTLDVALGAVALAVVVALALAPRRTRIAPALRAAAWLWLLGWLPVSHAIAPLQNTAADRYLLLPSLGLALGVAHLVAQIRGATARRALLAALLAAAALRTLDAERAWGSSLALWERAVESDPVDPGAWSHYAEALAASGDLPGALAVTAEGARVAPSPVLQLREALLRRQLGDAAGAAVAMRAAAEGGEPKAMSNLALMELGVGHVTDALAWARRGAAASPLRAQGQRALGQVALAAGVPAEALAAFTRAYALEAGNLDNRWNLAVALLALGRGAEARPHLAACRDDASDPARAAAAAAELAKLDAARP